MGFSWFLLCFSLLCGTVWLGWKWQLRGVDRALPFWVDLSRTIFAVFVCLLAVRSFVLEPYRIPTESMLPLLHSGDYIVVQKYRYGLRLPILHTQILPTGLPQRGDVVAFRKPGDEARHFVKRVVGLPGDRLFYRNRMLRINGEMVDLSFVNSDQSEADQAVVVAMERIGTASHRVIFQRGTKSVSDEFEKTVPAGHYFVMGDNRDNSQDSRDPEVGLVPYANLVGKASRVWMNMHEFSRAGTKIQ